MGVPDGKKRHDHHHSVPFPFDRTLIKRIHFDNFKHYRFHFQNFLHYLRTNILLATINGQSTLLVLCDLFELDYILKKKTERVASLTKN